VRANAATILAHLPKGHNVKLFAVVKANGYGHGAVQVAKAALNGGAWGLAVATLEEAEQLNGLVRGDQILVMGGLTAQNAASAAAAGCAVTVSSLELAKALSDRDVVVPVHLKIDTGMGRFGCSPADAPAIAKFIDEAPSLRLAGTSTHFASADKDEAMTRKQFDLLIDALATFEVDPGLRHACNSAATRRYPEFALDAVRAGIALYGCEWPGTRPATALRSVVAHLRPVGVGDTVGYGATWRAVARTPVATIAIGYADGVSRARSNRGHVLIRGHRAPLIGVVSMDAITVDVSNVPGVQVGDVVTVIGEDQGDRITAEEVAEWSDTISWEVLTSIGPRVERRYSPSP
jgi:alanine racemase